MLPGLTSLGALGGASLWAKSDPARHRSRQTARIGKTSVLIVLLRVGRTPWSAADPPVGLSANLSHRNCPRPGMRHMRIVRVLLQRDPERPLAQSRLLSLQRGASPRLGHRPRIVWRLRIDQMPLRLAGLLE